MTTKRKTRKAPHAPVPPPVPQSATEGQNTTSSGAWAYMAPTCAAERVVWVWCVGVKHIAADGRTVASLSIYATDVLAHRHAEQLARLMPGAGIMVSRHPVHDRSASLGQQDVTAPFA